LDRTLFDTNRFVHDVWSLAGREYGIDAEAERQRTSSFYRYYGDWYDYQFFDHLAHAVGESFDRQSFIALAHRELRGSYLYDDVTPEVIGLIDAILTFGNEPYQSLKLSLCPQLDGIERHIILAGKGKYIAETFSVPTVLIDDKAIGAEILHPALFIRIDRTGGDFDAKQGDLTIASLSELPDILSSMA
jgi:hypothetical protein